MGTRTDEAERAVSEQRARIAGMLDDLERRTRDDIHGVEEGMSARASEIKGRAADALDAIEGRLPLDTFNHQVAQHPLSSIATGFGAGVALGAASRGMGSGHERDRDSSAARDRMRGGSQREPDRADGFASGLLSGATTSVISALVAPVRDELQTLVRQAVAGFMGASGAGDEAPPRRPLDREDRSERRVRERDRGATVERDMERSAT